MRWVLQQAERVGGTPLIYAPGKRNIEDDRLFAQFASTYASMTWRTQSSAAWSGGPVLAAWPDAKHLGDVAEMWGTKALCVLAWNDKDIAAWAAATGAENLDPSSESISLPQLDPIVRCALKSLGDRVNHGNALAGAHDEADAKTWFRVLKRAGLPIDPDAMYAYALVDGWPTLGAERLREMATKVANGKSLQGWNEERWMPHVVDGWRSEAAAMD